MAGALDKQLRAAQKFLVGVQNLSNLSTFEDIRSRQLHELLRSTEKLSPSTEQAGRLVGSLDCGIFSCTKAAARLFGLGVFMPADVWACCETGPKLGAQEKKICTRAANLGLRHPTEQALALILACALNMDAQIRESEKFALLTKHKDQTLAAEAGSACLPVAAPFHFGGLAVRAEAACFSGWEFASQACEGGRASGFRKSLKTNRSFCASLSSGSNCLCERGVEDARRRWKMGTWMSLRVTKRHLLLKHRWSHEIWLRLHIPCETRRSRGKLLTMAQTLQVLQDSCQETVKELSMRQEANFIQTDRRFRRSRAAPCIALPR